MAKAKFWSQQSLSVLDHIVVSGDGLTDNHYLTPGLPLQRLDHVITLQHRGYTMTGSVRHCLFLTIETPSHHHDTFFEFPSHAPEFPSQPLTRERW